SATAAARNSTSIGVGGTGWSRTDRAASRWWSRRGSWPRPFGSRWRRAGRQPRGGRRFGLGARGGASPRAGKTPDPSLQQTAAPQVVLWSRSLRRLLSRVERWGTVRRRRARPNRLFDARRPEGVATGQPVLRPGQAGGPPNLALQRSQGQ